MHRLQSVRPGVQYDIDGRNTELLMIATDFAKDSIRRRAEKVRKGLQSQVEDDVFLAECDKAIAAFGERGENEIADTIINDVMHVYGVGSKVFTQEFLNYLKQLIAAELRRKDQQIEVLKSKVAAMARVRSR